MKTFSIATLGCKVNQFESEAIVDRLIKKGYRLVPFEDGADITVINTCTVTQRADFQSRQVVRRALRNNSDSLVIVTGCYSQVEPEVFNRINGVKYILGNREKEILPDIIPLMEKGDLAKVQVSDIQKEVFFSEAPISYFHFHTRAFLKIQDGCSSKCSYCIVPRARGPSRSLLPERVIANLKNLKKSGFKEVVITGINIGCYGLDLEPSYTLEKLLKKIEDEETPERIRLSSIEPLDLSDNLIYLISCSKKICPHLHIPIQNGDDEILKRMNRNYNSSFISDLILKIHERIPDVSIGADIIVGFPGETEERFKSTFSLIESLPFSYLHVFPYSSRKETPASLLPDIVDGKRITERAKILRELSTRKRHDFYQKFLNHRLSVLLEDRMDKNQERLRGLSRNYIPVMILNDIKKDIYYNLTNKECEVFISQFSGRYLGGRIEGVQDG